MRKFLPIIILLLAGNLFASSTEIVHEDIHCEGASRFQQVDLWLRDGQVTRSFIADNYLTNYMDKIATTCESSSYGDQASEEYSFAFEGLGSGRFEDAMSVTITSMITEKGKKHAFGFMRRAQFHGGELIPLWCEVK